MNPGAKRETTSLAHLQVTLFAVSILTVTAAGSGYLVRLGFARGFGLDAGQVTPDHETLVATVGLPGVFALAIVGTSALLWNAGSLIAGLGTGRLARLPRLWLVVVAIGSVSLGAVAACLAVNVFTTDGIGGDLAKIAGLTMMSAVLLGFGANVQPATLSVDGQGTDNPEPDREVRSLCRAIAACAGGAAIMIVAYNSYGVGPSMARELRANCDASELRIGSYLVRPAQVELRFLDAAADVFAGASHPATGTGREYALLLADDGTTLTLFPCDSVYGAANSPNTRVVELPRADFSSIEVVPPH